VRYYPLPVHKNSITSARAAEAAGKQGKFWEMHDALFEGQSVWLGKAQADQDMFLSYAERVGLNMEQYKQDVTSNSVGKKINDSKRDGMNL
jgi:predicted DsbA family dithiol-disulfide isomerase